MIYKGILSRKERQWGYIIELDKAEWTGLKSKFSTSTKGGKVKLPSAFPEKGLYMLATILKSPQAVRATLSIIETFAKIRELSRSIQELSNVKDKADQKALMQRSGELIAGIFDDDLQTSDTETSIELNFAVLKFKHTIKKKNKSVCSPAVRFSHHYPGSNSKPAKTALSIPGPCWSMKSGSAITAI